MAPLAVPAVEEFPLDGGRASLNFVATLGKRHRDPVERIPDGSALARWMVQAEVLPADLAVRPATAAQVRRAQALREAINRLVRGTMAGDQVDAADVELLNEAAYRPDLAPQLMPGEGGWVLVVASRMNCYDAALSTVARDAVTLLADARADRIKECAHPDCSLLFFDESQSGRRRWCSMERCGNQVKVSGYRHRRSATESVQG
jgi:predicted RNA-binding Zn ribbon-like protein